MNFFLFVFNNHILNIINNFNVKVCTIWSELKSEFHLNFQLHDLLNSNPIKKRFVFLFVTENFQITSINVMLECTPEENWSGELENNWKNCLIQHRLFERASSRQRRSFVKWWALELNSVIARTKRRRTNKVRERKLRGACMKL